MSGPVLIRGDQAITTKKDVAAGRESACLKDGMLGYAVYSKALIQSKCSLISSL